MTHDMEQCGQCFLMAAATGRAWITSPKEPGLTMVRDVGGFWFEVGAFTYRLPSGQLMILGGRQR